jgi:hypothetical protein
MSLSQKGMCGFLKVDLLSFQIVSSSSLDMGIEDIIIQQLYYMPKNLIRYC